MVVFQYRKTTISVSLRPTDGGKMQLDHCPYSLKGLWLQIFCEICYALAKEKWCVIGLAFVMNKTCAALHLYVPVRVAISVWILFREREKMTEILKAAKKTMQISRVFIYILFLNEITYDFCSWCRHVQLFSSVEASTSYLAFSVFFCQVFILYGYNQTACCGVIDNVTICHWLNIISYAYHHDMFGN
jgi:hypothetical protein